MGETGCEIIWCSNDPRGKGIDDDDDDDDDNDDDGDDLFTYVFYAFLLRSTVRLNDSSSVLCHRPTVCRYIKLALPMHPPPPPIHSLCLSSLNRYLKMHGTGTSRSGFFQ